MSLKFAVNNSLSAITALPDSISGGALNLISTSTASGVSAVNISSGIDSTYKEYILPIKKFKKSGAFQANTVKSRNITSIGVVAFGRDHQANIYVKDISFFK